MTITPDISVDDRTQERPLDPVQQAQSDEYHFPYHYLARLKNRGFSSFRNYNWSLSYICALQLVTGKLRKLKTSSHIDVGCGDGALVHHLARELPETRVTGIDYDERAINLARLFTPQATFLSGDIKTAQFPEKFDTATLVEVLEHIPPEQIDGFLGGVRHLLSDNARLIVTVPHANKPLEEKHYQHFGFDSLAAATDRHFVVEDMFGFERLDIRKRVLRRLLDNGMFFAEFAFLNRFLLARELRFGRKDGKRCGRIFAVLRCKA